MSNPTSRSPSGPVQRERVVDAVRLLRRHRHPRHDEPDPVATLRVDHENLPVEVEKHIEGRVTPLHTAYSYHTEATQAREGVGRLWDSRMALGALISLSFRPKAPAGGGL